MKVGERQTFRKNDKVPATIHNTNHFSRFTKDLDNPKTDVLIVFPFLSIWSTTNKTFNKTNTTNSISVKKTKKTLVLYKKSDDYRAKLQ